jgi:hypothetical protein
MKANELRIGNFYEIDQYPDDRIIIQIEDGIDIDLCNKLNASPIPLTEEWLLKFGFVKVKDDIFRLLEDDIIICTVSKIGSDEFEYEQLKVRGIYVQFVHQLQNLYFALTGEELTYGGNK